MDKNREGSRDFIGGSDARIIMGKDEAALLRLWREKRGEVEPEDLSGNLLVQLGLATEELNRRWYEANTGQAITDIQRQVRHPTVRWMGATLDGRVEATGAVFEAKFMLPWSFSEEAEKKGGGRCEGERRRLAERASDTGQAGHLRLRLRRRGGALGGPHGEGASRIVFRGRMLTGHGNGAKRAANIASVVSIPQSRSRRRGIGHVARPACGRTQGNCFT